MQVDHFVRRIKGKGEGHHTLDDRVGVRVSLDRPSGLHVWTAWVLDPQTVEEANMIEKGAEVTADLASAAGRRRATRFLVELIQSEREPFPSLRMEGWAEPI